MFINGGLPNTYAQRFQVMSRFTLSNKTFSIKRRIQGGRYFLLIHGWYIVAQAVFMSKRIESLTPFYRAAHARYLRVRTFASFCNHNHGFK